MTENEQIAEHLKKTDERQKNIEYARRIIAVFNRKGDGESEDLKTILNDFRKDVERDLISKGYRKVERGEWITPWVMKPYGKAHGTPYCSVCKQSDERKGAFCPFCGADMKSAKDDRKRKD